MKKIVFLVPILFLLLLSCFSTNECELSERYTPSMTKFVLDQGHQKYGYQVTFSQVVELYTGDCANEKSRNETSLKIMSQAPCDQILTVDINVNLGADSYTVKKDAVAITSGGIVDFGIVDYGGPRIDFAEITVKIFTALCPGDEE